MSNHVFISYARDDATDFARDLHDTLEKMGLNMWLDAEDIPKGSNWALTIQRAIMTCRAFIFVITPKSYESKVCNKELTQAFNSGKEILPVYLLTVDELPFLLNDLNYTDCRTDTKAGFQALFDEISKLPEGDETEVGDILVPESVTGIGASQAKIYSDPDDVDYLAEVGLFGRDDLLQQINRALSGDNARVLLQAFGGVGKTALAAQISADTIEETAQNVLWLRMGASESDAVFEALAHPFGASQAMAATPADDKHQLLRQLIRDANIGLVVLDDCWNGQSLIAVQKGIPRKVPMLVTARQTYPLTPIVRIPDLNPKDALALLKRLAPDLVKDETAANDLAQKLGYHAFALEVAGRTMQAKNYTAKALLTTIENTDVVNLKVPHEYQEAGRESIAALIETTLEALPDVAKAVFLAWGAFFSPQITPELLALYSVDLPEITQAEIDELRPRIKDEANFTDEQLRSYLVEQQAKSLTIDLQPTEDALNTLQQYGLASRQHAQQDSAGRPIQVASYRLHDLGFEYASANSSDEAHHRAVDVCLLHIGRYKQASLENFAALDPNIDTYMGAATFAYNTKRYKVCEDFAWGLSGGSEILSYRGYYSLERNFLQRAANAAKTRGDQLNQGRYLGNLGNAYSDIGDYEKAIDYHTQSLAIAEQIGDIRGKGNRLGNLGLAYSNLGDYEKAIDYYTQALAIAEQIGDIRGKGNRLGNLGNAYFSLGDYEKAIDYYTQALAISQQIGDKRGEGADLGNLGNAYSDLGDYEKAIDYMQQVLDISQQIGDKRSEGSALGNLGNAYFSLGDYEKAIDYYTQALAIRQQIGDKRGEGNDLGNLGIAYSNLGDYQQAIDYYTQALAISQQIGNKRGEGNQLGNLGNAYSNLGDYQQAIDYHTQALAVFQALGVPHLIEKVEHNLERARQAQAAAQSGDAAEE